MNTTATGVDRKPIERKRRASVAPPNVGAPTNAGTQAGPAPEPKPAPGPAPRTSAAFKVRIKSTVFARLQGHRKLTGQSNTEVLTTAFQTVSSDYRRLTGATVNSAAGGPPPRETPHKRSQRGQTRNLTIYYDGRQQEWLDQRVKDGGAPSRTELIETVLDKYLT